jgi:hypothetical protein
MLGCVIGLLVTWLMSKIWPPPETVKTVANKPDLGRSPPQTF